MAESGAGTAPTAGRELDVEIAVALFGYRWDGNPRGNRTLVNPDGTVVARKDRGKALHVFGMRGDWVEFYSADMNAAWQVVEKMHALGWDATVRYLSDGYVAEFVHYVNRASLVQIAVDPRQGGAPLAICHAALAALAGSPEEAR